MSSDAYEISVLSVDGARLRLRGASLGQPDDMAVTRSFVLMALGGADCCPVNLAAALAELRFVERSIDAAFYMEHVATFVRTTRVLLRASANAPHFEVEVDMKAAKWLKGLRPGTRFGTTAFDVFWEDPENPLEPEKRDERLKALEVFRKEHASSSTSTDGYTLMIARTIDQLCESGAIEVAASKRPALVRALARVSADDEIVLARRIVEKLQASKAVEEVYADERELVAAIVRLFGAS